MCVRPTVVVVVVDLVVVVVVEVVVVVVRSFFSSKFLQSAFSFVTNDEDTSVCPY